MKRDLALAHDSVQSNEKSARRKADDANASSSSAASTGSDSYDVFLSFSGQDTRKTFADHLYNGLFDASIRVFRDNNELREGEEIGTNLLQAIQNSKISIPILSQNYASSKWCLQELVEMTERIKSGHDVLPIFYHVEPTDVRNQTGSFGEAFSCLSRKYPEDVEKWKVALQEVASRKGWNSDGHEGELVKKVVRKILNELKKAFRLDVTKHLVGIDNAVEDVLRLLDDNPRATRIVGIYGMGGIGKTTLAKFVHNNLSDQFQHRSFIADIRESSRRNSIFYLQNQLIRDLKEKDQASYKDEGISLLGSRFKRKKVLILLDDVDDIEQIRALVGEYDWFEMGSRIIITTRSRFVLDKAKVERKYELEEKAEDESLVLFSRHAFRRDSPPREFESLSHDVVSTTGGLPLALEVIGSFLCGKDRAFWQNALKKLQKVPHEEVQGKLRISYEALNYEEKQIFLDIACFYVGINVGDIGNDVDEVSRMWDACDFFPNMGIETLSFMSLIKIEDNRVLKMHDQLKKLGREIVRQEDYNTPMNRSRLWAHEEALEVLQTNKGIEKVRVEGLLLDAIESPSEITTEQLEALPNLRLLEVRDAKLIGDSKSLLPKLRSLYWMGCPALVPTRFHLEKLVTLNLQESDISEIWEGWSHLQVAKQLKVLILRYCNNLKITPDLSPFRNLEMLNLRGCENLEKIHPSIGEARGLVFLFLMECKKLSKLPHEMGKLEELKELHIWETAIQEIPACVGSLKKLQWLDASDCSSLVALPDSISHLINLSVLDLNGCSGLCTLPKSIGSLVKLQRLSLSRTGVSIDLRFDYRIPNSIWKLEWLTELDLSYSGICELSKSIGDLKNLKILDISHCEKLSSLPSTIGKLGNLERFDATECENLGGEIHVDGLSTLKILRLSWSRISGFFDLFNKLSRLEKLEELDATECKNLGGEIPIDGLSSLKILRLSGTSVSGFVGTFDKLSCLKKLDLRNCKMLQSLPQSINKLPSLEHLGLTNCTNLRSLPELPTCLRVLDVTCQHQTLPRLSHLIHLEELVVDNCPLLESMPELPSRLLKFHAYNCRELKELPSLSSLEVLSNLHLGGCNELTEIKGLEALKSLVELNLFDCSKLSNLDGLEHLESLEYLWLGEFPESAAPLLNDDLFQVRDLDRLKNLKELRLSYCDCLIRPDLLQLTQLKRLSANRCRNLLEIKGLERLKNLERLDISWCASIETLPDLSCFNDLKFLYTCGCWNLRDVRGLEKVSYVEK